MSTYSPSLRIELITTGTAAGTWGTTTNDNLSTILDASIAGVAPVVVASSSQALTYLNGPTTSAANNESVRAMLNLSTSTSADFAVYAPPVSKMYVIKNSSPYTATIYNSTIAGNTTAAGSGVVIPSNKVMAVWSDGTNFLQQTTYLNSPTLVSPALGTPSSGNLANCTFPTLNQNTTGTATYATYPSGGGTFITSANIGSQSVSSATTATTATNQSGGTVSCTSASISSSAPTLSMVDSDGLDFSVHVNSNIWYVLNNGGSGVIYTDQSGNFTTAGGVTASGAIYSSANVTAYSDEKLKTNWRDLPVDFIEKLATVKCGTYDRTDITLTQDGVSAQSLQEVLPNCVVEAKDGFLSVAYGNAALVAAVHLSARVAEQEKRIAKLEALLLSKE